MAVNISNTLSNDGNDVLLVCTRDEGDLLQNLDKKVAYWLANKKTSLDVLVFLRFIKKIKSFKPEIIHAHSSSLYWAIVLKMFMPKLKLLFHDHYGMSDEIKSNDRKWLKRVSYFIDYTIVVNQNLLKWNQYYTHVDSPKVVFIRNFPYLKNLQGHGLVNSDTSCLKIVCLANLRRQKDHITLIQALNFIRNKGYIFCAQFIGEKWDDEYEFSVRESIKEHDLVEHIEITGPLNNIEKVLGQADIGVLSSMSEGLPVSLLEYGLAGLPVVVTNVGQCSEVVGHGKYGFVVAPRSWKTLASSLINIMDDYESARKMGEDFKQHILNQYGSKNFLKEYYSLLNS